MQNHYVSITSALRQHYVSLLWEFDKVTMKGGVHGFLLDNTTLLETIVGSLWISTQRGKAYQTRTCGGVEADLVVVFEHLPCEDDGGLGQLLLRCAPTLLRARKTFQDSKGTSTTPGD